MIKQYIKSTNLKDSTKAEHNQVMNTLYKMLQKCPLKEMKIEKEVAHWGRLIDTYNEHYTKRCVAQQSHDIQQLDKQRNLLVCQLFNLVKCYSKHPIPQYQRAGERLNNWCRYKGRDMIYMSLEAKTGVIDQLVYQLSLPQYAEDYTLCHLDEWVPLLQETNHKLDSLYRDRTLQWSQQEKGISQKSKKETQEYFKYLCHTINAYAVAFDYNLYTEAIHNINQCVKDAQHLIKIRRASKKR